MTAGFRNGASSFALILPRIPAFPVPEAMPLRLHSFFILF